jgi:hypothetical protein
MSIFADLNHCNEQNSNKIFTYRITGPQSIERLESLVNSLYKSNNLYSCPLNWSNINDIEEDINNMKDIKEDNKELQKFNSIDNKIDFIWETTCEKIWLERHMNAIVINKLHNTNIIENKSNLAFLQLRMKQKHVLETFVATNKNTVKRWSENKWLNNSLLNDEITNKCSDKDWWAVKASAGNGGKDVWIINKSNFKDILKELPGNNEFVIQKYVDRPLLYKGKKKFHFRCYSVLNADMSVLIYEKAFILSASMDYDKEDSNSMKHITNLSVNKASIDHPGQVPCHLPTEYPDLFERIKELWLDIAEASAPFMSHQRNSNNFEFFGIDIIADEDGACWFIEANRLPGLESSLLNKLQEDNLYNEMMLSLLKIVTYPLVSPYYLNQDINNCPSTDLWVHLQPTSDIKNHLNSSDVWMNTLNWRAFTKKNKSKIVI